MERCRDIVVAIEPGADVILYGSHVRGDSGPDSDYDIFVLVDGSLTRELEDRISFAIYDLEYEADVILSVHVYEKSFFQSPLGKVMPLFNIDLYSLSSHFLKVNYIFKRRINFRTTWPKKSSLNLQ
ncbi:MAG: nucleotidyltransferase domain-containing protein [Deltaproteobacteria bacterium]|nr:nucleotidyltransferase domain-containing protein [Deltaproteobacteria bacterium]MBW1737086.1 nucleotidyltransferase domain-containing protein [Deltaproteobacteria bacterium]MBW2033045.1 nucleotidyltransferase domain-containing protein [Deltaproteobacteria bacterium]MBW2114020.1 nucleotidyltransferase domain-containing protein [Deltaproteobacteria bacterium]MBW2170086.1 nucleotidyltransferase domain-containing protein [Deltaproteobacteria bacterium]